jgi:hypothetical protein
VDDHDRLARARPFVVELDAVHVGARHTTVSLRFAVVRPPAGLCDSCRHQRIVKNTRGSEFSLCERSRTEPDYPRYPRVPVTSCRGHELRDPPEPRPPD